MDAMGNKSTDLFFPCRMRLVGQDKEPLDLSQDKYIGAFYGSLQSWQKKMADNADGSKFGFIDIEGVDLQAFGTPYPA